MKKLLGLLALLAALGGSARAQGGPQNVKGTFGSGPPGNSTPCTKIGDQYTDISTSILYVATAISQTATVTSCTWTAGGGVSSPSSLTAFFSGYQGLAPQDFGAKGDGREAYDGVLSSGSATVTSATAGFCNGTTVACTGLEGNGNAKSSDIGRQFEAVCSGNSVGGLTIASVQSATSITLSSTQATCNAGSVQIFIGTDDTAALQAWVAAGMALHTLHNFYLPKGYYYTSKALVFLNTNPTGECSAHVNTNQPITCGLQLIGAGPTVSMIHPATGSNFNWTSGAPNANNNGIVYIQGFSFGTLMAFGIEGDGVAYSSTGLTAGGAAAALYLNQLSHFYSASLWVNRVVISDGTVNNRQGFYDAGCFECSFYNSAIEGNGNGSNAKIVLAEKELYDTIYFEMAGATINNVVVNNGAAGFIQDRMHNIHLQQAGTDTNGSQMFISAGNANPAGQSLLLEGIRMDGGSSTDVGFWLFTCTGGLIDFEGSNLINATNSATARLIRIDSGVTCPVTFNGGSMNAGGGTGVAVLNNAAGANVYINNAPVTGAISGTNAAGVFQLGQSATGWGGNGGITGTYFVSNQGTAAANGQIALSAGWGTTATVTAAAGFNQHGRFTLTSSGTGQAANPTVTWTLPNALPTATVLCMAVMVGGTGAQTSLQQTSLSATAPVFTFNGTPVAASTYIIDVVCGP